MNKFNEMQYSLTRIRLTLIKSTCINRECDIGLRIYCINDVTW